MQARTGFGHRDVMTDRGHGVLQGTAATHMHMHIAAGHRRQVQAGGQVQALFKVAGIVLAAMQLHGQPQAIGKGAAQPLDMDLGVGVFDHP